MTYKSSITHKHNHIQSLPLLWGQFVLRWLCVCHSKVYIFCWALSHVVVIRVYLFVDANKILCQCKSPQCIFSESLDNVFGLVLWLMSMTYGWMVSHIWGFFKNWTVLICRFYSIIRTGVCCETSKIYSRMTANSFSCTPENSIMAQLWQICTPCILAYTAHCGMHYAVAINSQNERHTFVPSLSLDVR